MSNTFLELEVTEARVDHLKTLMNPNAWMLEFLPDTAADVAAEVRKGNDVFDEYAAATLHLKKIDRFTDQPYPFFAHRPIDLVAAIVNAGFSLHEVQKSAAQMPSAPPTIITNASPVLWAVARRLICTFFDLFSDSAHIAWQHTHVQRERTPLLKWSRACEAMLRHLLLIEASHFAKPNTRPLLDANKLLGRKRVRRLVTFEPDKPEEWRVSFRCFVSSPARGGSVSARRAMTKGANSRAAPPSPSATPPPQTGEENTTASRAQNGGAQATGRRGNSTMPGHSRCALKRCCASSTIPRRTRNA